MRYKNNALDKINQLDATVNKLQFQINRGFDQEQLSDTTTSLKEQLENLREMISIEPDDFEQQFAPRQ
jgi:hypothetical protein